MNWDAIAARYDALRCPGCPIGDHGRGWAQGRFVHWADRRFTRAGLRRYLMLVSITRLLDVSALPVWDRLYRQNAWAAQAARDLHVRLPARLADADRAAVAWQARHATIPAHVRRWTRRTSA